MTTRTCGIVLVAAGSGTRMGAGQPKQFRQLLGKPVIIWSALAFAQMPEVREIVVVTAPDFAEDVRAMFEAHGLTAKIALGGARRQDSVLAGVRALSHDTEFAAVHDAARPFPPANLGEALGSAAETGAAIFALPVTDTLKRGDDGNITGTVDRAGLWRAQTPQVARRRLLIDALEACGSCEVTDEAAALERAGVSVRLVMSAAENIKITTAEDWTMAEAIATWRQIS